MRSTLGLKQKFLNNGPKTLNTTTQIKPNIKFSTFQITQRNFQNFPFGSTKIAPKTSEKLFFAPVFSRRHFSTVGVDGEEIEEEEGEKAEKIKVEDLEKELEVEQDLLTKIPGENERIEYYNQFKIATEIDCAKFTKMMRTLPLRKLSLEEQDVLFRKREAVEKRLKYLQKLKESEASADLLFDSIDDLYQGTTEPMINPSLKENIYETWVQSPTQWTLEKLAQRFRLKKLRVRAILMLKIDEKRLLKSNPEAVIAEGDNVDYEYARFYGMIGKNQHFVDEIDERYHLNYKTSPFSPIVTVVEEEVEGEKMKRMAFTQKKFPDQLPADPPNPDGRNDNQELWGADPLRQNMKVGRKRLKRKGENTLVVLYNPDTPRLHEKINGMIYLVRPDGSARTATWDERRAFWRQSPRGEWAAKTQPDDRIALDPIYFPVDEKEERLMKLQNNSPKVQNRKWNTPVIITEKETFIKRMSSKGIENVFTAWEKYKKKYGELTPESTIFDAPPPTAPYAGTPVVYY